MTTKALLKANALKPRDRLGLVAPGGRPYKPSVVSRAAKLIEEMGFEPVVGQNVLEVRGHNAGTVEQRVGDMNRFLNDDSIAGLLCITGGFGALSLLPHLDYGAIDKHPKIIVGGGENTTLLLAAHSRTNLVAFHGPNLEDVRSQQCFDSLKTALTRKSALKPITAATVNGAWAGDHSYVPIEGVGQGALLGGNLTALVSMFGTPFEPSLKDCVVFLTDHDERNDILDRWFTTLYVSGQLASVSAMAIGLFDDCGNKGSFNLLSIEDSFSERLKQLEIPSLFDFPVAGGFHPTVPLGVRCTLDSRIQRLEFLESSLT